MADTANNFVNTGNLTMPPTTTRVVDEKGAFTLPYRLFFENGANQTNAVTYGHNAALDEALAELGAIQANAAIFQNTVTEIATLANGVISDLDNAVASVDNLAIVTLEGQMVSTGTYGLLTNVAYIEGIPVGTVIENHAIQQDANNTIYVENFSLLGGRLDGDKVGWLLSNSFVYVDPDTTLTLKFEQQAAYTDNSSALVNSQVTALATSLGAVAQEVTVLTANTANNFATTTSLIQTVTNKANATAQDLTFLGVANETGRTFSLNDTTVFISSTGQSVATTLTGLSSQIGNNRALITSEATTRASADSALSQQINVVSTTVNGHTAQITELFESQGGTSATVGLTLDVNNYITGWVQTNNGQTGKSIFLVDDFAIVTPGIAPFIPFEVRNGTVFMPHAVVGTLDVNTVNTNNINIGAVGTGQLAGGAVTGVTVNSNPTAISGIVTAPVQVLSYPFTNTAGGTMNIFLRTRVTITHNPSGISAVDILVYRDGVQIDITRNIMNNVGAGFYNDYLMIVTDSPGVGTHTYTIYLATENAGFTAQMNSIETTTMEYKR